ncbi:DUF4365 domain-containing protein [Acinetobacter sp. A3.8]|uniref:DUF4365 domain-containing protein n=1 Tax=Acinetobacter sedimenti TaxID=2919922 RepID=A0A9X2B5B3_9GAMM|nr:DUF4365 domain-containing protein [Acinetobacter sedimenti]MCJ8145358.1 DUF4365 domain-containing protein [Acinetobacter sedimenti]
MLNSITERTAIYTVANYFTQLGWIFREQANSDFGIDALVEVAKNGRPTGQLIALQIKGGSSNFRKTKTGLTFYFEERHKLYWLNFRIPVLVILHDPLSDSMFWGEVNGDSIKPTRKMWKLQIPYGNQLTVLSKHALEQTLSCSKIYVDIDLKNSTDLIDLSEKVDEDDSYCEIINSEVDGLELIVNTENYSENIKLSYKPKNSDWDDDRNRLKWTDRRYFLFEKLLNYISSVMQSCDIYKLTEAVEEIKCLIKQGGLNKVDEFLFDYNNIDSDIPKYAEFINTIERFLFLNELDKHGLEVCTGDEEVYFYINNESYIVDTFEGKIKNLKDCIDNQSYNDLLAMTDISIWSTIYCDAGIEKDKFIPVMYDLWEMYWDDEYERIKKSIKECQNANVVVDENSLTATKYLDKLKNKSWRSFQLFSEGYNDAGDIIAYAYNLDFSILYPMAIVAMMNVFDQEICYWEYCDFHFSSENWELIFMDDELDDSKPAFYIQKIEY